ncbi:hypothetical protein Nepgr_007074 [Nepenthes gracilis]|uniref:Protein PYRICULARIA ORYZAE RESISTANCE 21-like n=1 Tax=Nepenthes gracilis TaxID=150966 RepID=A0AAD3XI04_NEPGR|nr:hypothetical protein Nepgr_007074 [Nepenthes gracilis]
MVLKVDLQCQRCYKKVKKVLCKFPQIRDQAYDEKKNAVIIKVVCCNPERIRDKLCCKGGGSIRSIEIKEPEKEPKPDKRKPVQDKPNSDSPEVVIVPADPPPSTGCPPCYPRRVCCGQCYAGQAGGPCYYGYGRPPPPPLPPAGCDSYGYGFGYGYGYGYGYDYGWNWGYSVCRCGECL